jgi:hypothetical protein
MPGNLLETLLRHDSAALARYARTGLTAKSCPLHQKWPTFGWTAPAEEVG